MSFSRHGKASFEYRLCPKRKLLYNCCKIHESNWWTLLDPTRITLINKSRKDAYDEQVSIMCLVYIVRETGGVAVCDTGGNEWKSEPLSCTRVPPYRDKSETLARFRPITVARRRTAGKEQQDENRSRFRSEAREKVVVREQRREMILTRAFAHAVPMIKWPPGSTLTLKSLIKRNTTWSHRLEMSSRLLDVMEI